MESQELKVHGILLWSFTRLPRPCVVIPFTAVQERAAPLRSHSTSGQNLDKLRGVPGFDGWHREFPH